MLLRASSVALLLVLFGAADALRTADVRTATLLSMGGWVAFGVLFLAWAWAGVESGAALRQCGRLAALTLVAFAVLLAYYLRSRLIETGPHTDAVFTYQGLRSFLALENPITFAGRTPSYPQASLMLLLHLPGVAVGFEALGPLAIPLGAIVHLALLLGVAVDLLATGSLRAKCAVVALAAGVYSNRLLVLTYDITGYAFPGVCLGLMFLVLVAGDLDRPNRAIGGLLAVALLHHYPGFFMVLPLCVAWLVLAREPWRRVQGFVADNPVVIAVLLMLAVSLATNPELMLNRIADVSVGPSGLESLRQKVRGNLVFLKAIGPLLRHEFYENTRGSWFLLSIPALGGFVLPLAAGAWLVSFWTVERRVRYLLLLLALAVGLGALTIVQDLLTTWSDYRQFPFLFAMFTTGLAFVLRLPSLRGPRRMLAAAYAIGFALYNYVDLGSFHGATHGVETAYRSQATMDTLRRFVDRPDAVRRLGAAKLFVVVDPFFPLEPLYLEVLAPRAGVPIKTIPVGEACPHGRMAEDEVSRRACKSFLVVAHATHCGAEGASPPDRRSPVLGRLYEAVCDRPEGTAAVRRVVDVDVASR
jgi:hypothetical protein